MTPGFYYLFGISPKGVPSVATIVQVTDPKYFVGAGSATPVDLATQKLRTSSAGSITAVQQPAAPARAAKKIAVAPLSTEANLASDVTVPAGKPIAPARSSEAWMIVLIALMGAVLTRRIWSLARR